MWGTPVPLHGGLLILVFFFFFSVFFNVCFNTYVPPVSFVIEWEGMWWWDFISPFYLKSVLCWETRSLFTVSKLIVKFGFIKDEN